jgi:hypothetical protein
LAEVAGSARRRRFGFWVLAGMVNVLVLLLIPQELETCSQRMKRCATQNRLSTPTVSHKV